MLHTFVFDRKTIYKNQGLIIYITNDEFQVTCREIFYQTIIKTSKNVITNSHQKNYSNQFELQHFCGAI